ncbi:MAG: phosphate ABC transporter permease subunit PstC [Chloroflexota bacterium]|nr:phosphate ABC transporter permease subunit PstC [Chloroflexota bacterium]
MADSWIERRPIPRDKTQRATSSREMRTKRRRLVDRMGGQMMGGLAVGTALLVVVMVIALLARAWPILRSHPLKELVLGRTWHPLQGAFGFWPFIVGTLWVTGLGMVIAVPVCTLCAIYLAEYAPSTVRQLVKPLIDVLAGIPSVVYGLWGVLTVVPLIREHVGPWMDHHLGHIPLFSTATNPTGYGVLAGGVVLAVMVFPIIISVMEEVLRSVPDGLREATLALGVTRWIMVRKVILRRALPGVVAAVVLGFSRALGETMAVLMVVGNVPQVPQSLFDAGYPLTSLIANNFGEMMSIPLYDAALMAAGLFLLLVVLGFNMLAWLVLRRMSMSERAR